MKFVIGLIVGVLVGLGVYWYVSVRDPGVEPMKQVGEAAAQAGETVKDKLDPEAIPRAYAHHPGTDEEPGNAGRNSTPAPGFPLGPQRSAGRGASEPTVAGFERHLLSPTLLHFAEERDLVRVRSCARQR